MTLMPNAAAVAEIASDNSVLPVSRIECHYAQNSFFLPTDNYVLENVSVIQEIPCLIVQGRYDVICPSSAAWELHRALCNSELEIVPSGSHSPMEPEMSASLIRATNRFKDIVSIRSG